MSNPPPPMPPQMDEPGDVFGPLGHYLLFTLRAPWRHKRLAAGVLLGCVALGVVASVVMPQKYHVEATVLVQRNPLTSALSGPGVSHEWDTPTRAAREVVIRRDNLVALCRQTDFVNRYLETRAPAVRFRDWLLKTFVRYERSEAQLLDDLVSTLETRLTVSVSLEGAVTIGFIWSDPDITYQIVEAAVRSFVQARSESEIGAMAEAIAILQGHDARLQEEIATAIRQLDEKEQALRGRSIARRTLPASPVHKRDEELQQLRTALTARRRALADVEEFRQRRLAELQLQLSQQLAVYAPEHPAVIGTRQAMAGLTTPSPQVGDLKAEVAQLERKIAERSGGVVDLPNDAAAIDQGLALARARLLEETDPRLEYERRQLETLLRRHSSLVERIESTRIELDGARSAFDQRYPTITPARRPKGPMKPYRLIFAMGGVVLGLVGACFAAAARDLWSGVIVEPWQVEENLNLPVIVRARR